MPDDATGSVTMRIWRGDPLGGEFTDYVVPAVEGEVVLDVIHRIQAGEAPDLACRWNCKAGKCGSCSAEINGLPRLMCMTRMDTLPVGAPVVVAPMKAFPIIRDHEENKPKYSGPRFFIRYAELEMHPLDTNDRRELARSRAGLGMCNITKCCTEVCPEHIKITDNGIIPMKERVVDAHYDPVGWLGRKVMKRTKKTAEEAAAG